MNGPEETAGPREVVETGFLVSGSPRRWGLALEHWAALLFDRGTRAWWVRLAGFNALARIALAGAVVFGTAWTMRPMTIDARAAGGSVAGSGPGSTGAGDPETTAPGWNIDAKRLFGLPANPTRPRAPKSNVTLSELSRHLHLQGLLGGENPRAILMNDKTKQVLYLAPGEFVGEIRVLEVRGNSVILSWKDETLELFL